VDGLRQIRRATPIECLKPQPHQRFPGYLEGRRDQSMAT
jgi:hypothetical protein